MVIFKLSLLKKKKTEGPLAVYDFTPFISGKVGKLVCTGNFSIVNDCSLNFPIFMIVIMYLY